MAEQAYAYVTLIPVAKGFKSALTKELQGVGGVGGTVGKDAGNKFSAGFGGALKGLAVTVGGALAAIGVGRFLGDSIKQASDLGESINAVNVAYLDYADDILALGEDVADRLGLSTVDFNAAAVRFSAFAERIAGEGGNVAGVVDSLTSRAADFASVFNIEVSEALQIFQSGLSGEAEPLKRFGINLLDSEVRAYAYANGIGQVGKELTETEKVQARYGLLLESTAKTAGDFANTSDGLANSQRILQANITNLQAQVGEGLTPIMATLTSTLVPLAEYIFPRIASFVNDTLVPVLDNATQNIQRLVGQFTTGYLDLDGVLDRITAKIREFFEGGGLNDAFGKLAEYRSTIFNAVLEAVPGIVEAFVEFFPQLVSFFVNVMLPRLIDEMTNIVTHLVDIVAELLPQIIRMLLGAIPDLLRSAILLFTQLVNAVIDITPQLIDTIIDLLPEIVDSLLSMLPEILDAAIQLFTAIVRAIPRIIPPLVEALIDLTPVIIDTLLDMLPELIDAAFKLFTGVVSGIFRATPDIVGAVGDLIPKMLSTVANAIPQFIRMGGEIIAGLVSGIVTNGPRLVGEAIGNVVGSVIEGAKGLLGIRSPSKVFHEMGENIGQGLINGIESMFNGVQATAEQLAALAAAPTAETLEALGITTTYSGYGVPTLVPTVTGDTLDVGKLTDTLNSLQKAGYNNVAETAFGGSFQQALDKVLGQRSFYNPTTGQTTTVGGSITPEGLERVLGPGFQELPSLNKSVEELTDVIDSLNDQVAQRGLTPFASGGLVTGPTSALIGEAGPEVVIPLNRFEQMMGLTDKAAGKTVNYYAAPNQSIDSERALFQAMRRAKVVANW